MSSWIRQVAVLATLALAVGCGAETSNGDGDARSGGRTPIEGRTLVVTKVTDAGRPHEVVPGSQIRLELRNGSLRLNAGCNHLSGDYEIVGDTITVGPIGGTEMGCPPELMAQDTWLAGLFTEPVTIGESPLTLTAGDVVLELADRETVSPDAPLTGVRWVLDSLVSGGSVSSVPQGVTAGLVIAEDGSVRLGTGCNRATGTVEINRDVITWRALAVTKKACADPAANSVERQVLGVLAGDTTYRIDEQSLTITNRDTGALGFRVGQATAE